MNEKIKPSGPKVPAWATSHFRRTVEACETLVRLIHISERGISVLRAMPKIEKVLAEVEGKVNDAASKSRLEVAEREAALAQSEVDRDFPVLHGLAVVALWSELEHFTKGLIALWLSHRKDALLVPAVQKLKVKLGDYLQVSKLEQARYLVELLEQDLASPLKRGPSRFQSLLEPFGLESPVSDEGQKTLFELQQVRNVMAHRNGIADRKFKKDCPWIRVKMNESVPVSRKALQLYYDAVMGFSLNVFYRIGDAYGHDLRPPNQVQPPARSVDVKINVR